MLRSCLSVKTTLGRQTPSELKALRKVQLLLNTTKVRPSASSRNPISMWVQFIIFTLPCACFYFCSVGLVR